ncbi:LAETG motif-containing sortase-dependent surface protein [Streptomyces sp. NPDC051218]|uniref:LAETG motif-containing sortase-dependent surface protein n=1 Tax=Streptomyces sp. NPDC051218 TaxID=3365645 RepID=UPI0037A3A855
MKLRRVMAAAAATAAIAPIALLSAPAAFATEDTTPAPSATATESATPSATATPTEKPTESATPTPSATESTTASPTASATETGKPTEEPTESEEPTDEPTVEPTDCAVDDEGQDTDSKLEIGLSGLPGKIVAGSGWHQFKLTASNPSDEDLGEVQWLAMVDNYAENEKDWLANYAQIQYFNPESKAWESITDEVSGGLYFGTTELGAKEKVDIKLRLNVSAKAPAGDGYALGLGGYLDSEENCVHNAFSFYEFTVLKAGSENENPGEADESTGGKTPNGGKTPTGGAKDIPVTGNLAETGSSSMLPTIGLVGGVAVIAGAGAVFVVRRKKADATA